MSAHCDRCGAILEDGISGVCAPCRAALPPPKGRQSGPLLPVAAALVAGTLVWAGLRLNALGSFQHGEAFDLKELADEAAQHILVFDQEDGFHVRLRYHPGGRGQARFSKEGLRKTAQTVRKAETLNPAGVF